MVVPLTVGSCKALVEYQTKEKTMDISISTSPVAQLATPVSIEYGVLDFKGVINHANPAQETDEAGGEKYALFEQA